MTFRLYNSMRMIGTPSLPGTLPCFTTGWLFAGDAAPTATTPLDPAKVRAAVDAAPAGGTLIFDIECWDRWSVETGRLATIRALDVLRLAKKHACSIHKKLVYGFYDWPRAYYDLRLGTAEDYIVVSEMNRSDRSFTRSLVGGMPCLYARSDNRKQWVLEAMLALGDCAAIGVPAYPFLWPTGRFDTNESGGMIEVPLDPEFFDFQISTLRRLGAAGCVLWGANNCPWDESYGAVIRKWAAERAAEVAWVAAAVAEKIPRHSPGASPPERIETKDKMATNTMAAAERAWSEYYNVKVSALAAYDDTKAAARAAYDNDVAPAWAAYERKVAAAQADYERKVAPSQAVYKAAEATALAVYNAAIAAARPGFLPRGF